ncbi:MAG: pyridoxal-phosphate dependent enzyme, partial [Chloroflexi bacterium]
ESTSQMARDRIAAEGAELIIHGASWDETDTFARTLVEKVGGAYVPPFDHPAIWRGNATVIDEAAAQCPTRPDAVIVSVGGGGLFCGVVDGMQRHGWVDIPVLAAETIGAESLAASLRAGERVTLPEIRSIASTLGARTVAARAFELAQQHPTFPVVVSDADAVDACLRFAADQRVIVEPACGASLAMLYRHADLLAPYASVLVIVCGGAGADLHQLLRWQAALV